MDLATTIQHFRDLYRSFEFWIFVFDQTGETAIRHMRNRFYGNAGPDNFLCVSLPPTPLRLGLVAARKSQMLGRDLRRHLQRYTPSEFLPTTWERDIYVVTAPENLALAGGIVSTVLEYGDLSILAGRVEQEAAA